MTRGELARVRNLQDDEEHAGADVWKNDSTQFPAVLSLAQRLKQYYYIQYNTHIHTLYMNKMM